MYIRQKAVEYAYKWWNKRNPEYFNFEDYGGDCTSFVSQCLYNGNIGMNYDTDGWNYINSDRRSPSWAGVQEFFSFCIKNTSSNGVRAIQCSISDIEIGDVIQIRMRGYQRFHHTLLVTRITGEKTPSDILVTCHSMDSKDRPLKSFYYEQIRFLKILN